MFPIKYIDNNLVWNKDNEVFAYYELIPYNYSFLSAEQKFIVHDSFRQLIAQSREGKIHALQIATESSIRSMQEQSKKLVTGKLKEVAYQKIDEQTEALVSMIGDNQVDYRFFLGFKLMVTEEQLNLKNIKKSAWLTFTEFLHEVNHTLMNDFVSMPNDEINRYMKMEKLLENKISRRFKVRRLEINDFGYLMEHLYGRDGIAYEDYEYQLPKKKLNKSIQTLAGVTENGFSSTGFYVGFLLLIILVVGMYVAYTGLIKRETSKALHAVINFVVVFILSASFIAYAPDYIKKINEFSSDISTASLDLGTKIMLPNSDSEGKDSVDLIRDSLFSIQVEQPWLLLQFGNSNAEEIGTDRVEALVSASPEDEDGKTREEVVKTEIEDNDNNNLTIPQVVNRLGMVFFLLFFNLGITIFVFLLTGMMLFSQILFIIFAMFLPISFLLSMIPSYESMAKQAIVLSMTLPHFWKHSLSSIQQPQKKSLLTM